MNNNQRGAATVVAGWTAGNGILAALLVGFHERPFAIVLYAGAAAIPALLAAALAIAPAGNPDAEHEFTVPGGARWVLTAAAGLELIGLAAIWGNVLAVLGGVLLAVSVGRLLIRPTGDRRAVDAAS